MTIFFSLSQRTEQITIRHKLKQSRFDIFQEKHPVFRGVQEEVG